MPIGFDFERAWTSSSSPIGLLPESESFLFLPHFLQSSIGPGQRVGVLLPMAKYLGTYTLSLVFGDTKNGGNTLEVPWDGTVLPCPCEKSDECATLSQSHCGDGVGPIAR